jgi:hypothetical protein
MAAIQILIQLLIFLTEQRLKRSAPKKFPDGNHLRGDMYMPSIRMNGVIFTSSLVGKMKKANSL